MVSLSHHIFTGCIFLGLKGICNLSPFIRVHSLQNLNFSKEGLEFLSLFGSSVLNDVVEAVSIEGEKNRVSLGSDGGSSRGIVKEG